MNFELLCLIPQVFNLCLALDHLVLILVIVFRGYCRLMSKKKSLSGVLGFTPWPQCLYPSSPVGRWGARISAFLGCQWSLVLFIDSLKNLPNIEKSLGAIQIFFQKNKIYQNVPNVKTNVTQSGNGRILLHT